MRTVPLHYIGAARAFKVTSGTKAVAVVTLGGTSTSARFLVK